MNQFPASFLWGASSSAFQIEGGWDEGGKGMTVADFNSFKLSDKQADTKVASDFYHHWKEDIDLMKELGLKAYRFSLSWARIIPDGDGEVNPEGIAFYNKVIDYLIEQGICPQSPCTTSTCPMRWSRSTTAGNAATAPTPLSAMHGSASVPLATASNTGRSSTSRI